MTQMELRDDKRTNKLFRVRYEAECLRINRFMVWLMLAQWMAGIGFSVFYSPLTWIGEQYAIHVHVWAAMLLGGAISSFAIIWLHLFPKMAHTRHVIAISQMLWSALLIHLSGGRIETHFHVFGSLAILSIYRDWKILITATLVVAVDHFVRGVFYPLSAFGIVTESPYRWIEHAAWVIFEVAFLVPGCMRLRKEIWELCRRQTELLEAKQQVDRMVIERTRELVATNRLLAQKTAEEEKLALVARFTDNAVVITDKDMRIEWVNDGFRRITGHRPEDVLGKSAVDYQIGPKTDAKTRAYIEKSIQEGTAFDVELISQRKSSEPYWLACEVRPILDSRGNISRFVAIQRDISQRKSIELSLAATEQRLRSLINNVPGAFYRCSANENQGMMFVSTSITEITGFQPQEFVELKKVSKQDLVHPEDASQVIHTIEQSIARLDGFEIEYRLVDHSGNIKWVAEYGQCMTDNDGEVVIDGMIFDVTERKLSEAKNSQLQRELVDASRKAGMAEVATGVLHNVGNILNSVNVSGSRIQKQMDNSALTKLERIAQLISDQGDSVFEFISQDKRGRKVPNYIVKLADSLRKERDDVSDEFDDLLHNVEHIKQIVSVQQSMAKSSGMMQELALGEIVESVVTATKGLLANHNIRFTRRGDQLDARFVSDKHKILQILINLVGNAKDAIVELHPDDPEIVLWTNCVNDRVEFTVADNGIGIGADKMAKLFQHSFTTKANGHGFGLHSCANTAKALGGVLSVNSPGEGQGATFTLSLPTNQAETPATSNNNEPNMEASIC